MTTALCKENVRHHFNQKELFRGSEVVLYFLLKLQSGGMTFSNSQKALVCFGDFALVFFMWQL